MSMEDKKEQNDTVQQVSFDTISRELARITRQKQDAFREFKKFIPSIEQLNRELTPLSAEEEQIYSRYMSFVIDTLRLQNQINANITAMDALRPSDKVMNHVVKSIIEQLS